MMVFCLVLSGCLEKTGIQVEKNKLEYEEANQEDFETCLSNSHDFVKDYGTDSSTENEIYSDMNNISYIEELNKTTLNKIDDEGQTDSMHMKVEENEVLEQNKIITEKELYKKSSGEIHEDIQIGSMHMKVDGNGTLEQTTKVTQNNIEVTYESWK